jgi:hypothetical protein
MEIEKFDEDAGQTPQQSRAENQQAAALNVIARRSR